MDRSAIEALPADWRASRRAAISPTAWALGAWLALIAGAALVGAWLNRDEPGIELSAPPLVGDFRFGLGPETLLAVAVGAAAVWAAPRLATRVGWRRLLGLSALGALVWATALALIDGPEGISGPLNSRHEYLTDVPLISSPGDFLAHFTERIDVYETHVRGHPPGMVLGLWGLAELGLGGSWPASVLIVLAAATIAPATLIAAREVAGEAIARRAAPFVAIAPAAIWWAVSADAVYAAVGAWSVALLVIAIGRRGRRSDLSALGGGLLFGLALFLSYGIILLGAIPLVVAARARRVRPLAVAAVGAALVAVAFLAAGFWWLDGLNATREQYAGSAAKNRPYAYFLFANLAALALALGPAAAVALARLPGVRPRNAGLLALVAGGLVAVLAADLTGLSKAEVERIWLPFMPWIMLATVSLWEPPGSVRVWLGAQVGCALAISLAVRTAW